MKGKQYYTELFGVYMRTKKIAKKKKERKRNPV